MDKEALINGIENLLTDMSTRTGDSKKEYAERMAGLIEAFVKSASIRYDNGLMAPNGAVTGTFNGGLQ